MLLIELSREVIEFSTQPQLALAPLVIPLVMLGINLASSITKGVRANKEKKMAEDAINNYKRQKLKNVYEGTSYYNTAARNYAQKQINQNMGNVVSAAKQGGARSAGVAVAGQENANNAALKQAAMEQDAFGQWTTKVAQGEDRIQQMQETRETQDISGLASMYAAARADQNAAIDEGFQSVANSAGMYMGLKGVTDGNSNEKSTTNTTYTGSINDYSYEEQQQIDPEGTGFGG